MVVNTCVIPRGLLLVLRCKYECSISEFGESFAYASVEWEVIYRVSKLG